MISYKKGSIFNSNMQTLVNPVNTVGVMGKGLALSFKQKFPEMYEGYKILCATGVIRTGNPWLWKGSRWILNFPTKEDWHEPSKIEYIEDGLDWFCKSYQFCGIESIAFPKLGCGLGQLCWIEVQPIMENYLGSLPIEIEIYV